MSTSNMAFDNYPEWYRIERDTDKIIKKLTTIKELIPYLNNSDEYIRRLSILRINDLRLKDAIVALKELLDDPLETAANKELAAWTIKVIINHWNTDLFITSKYLNNYTGKERYEDICKVNIKDTLPSLRFDFTSSMLNSELSIESNDIRSSKDTDFDLPFSVKEWFLNYSQDILSDLKNMLIKLPFIIFKGIKYAFAFIFGGLVFIFKGLRGLMSGIKQRSKEKHKKENYNNTSSYESMTSNSYNESGKNYRAQNIGAGEFQYLRNSFNSNSYDFTHEEKISLKERITKAFMSFAYILCTPVRFVIKHKKLSIIGLVMLYCFLCFFPHGKALTYKFTGLDLMDEQARAFNTVKGVVAYVWDEINDILSVTSTRVVEAESDTEVETTPQPVEITTSRYKVTAKTGLNLREEPDTSSKKLLQLPFESIVTKEAEEGIWYKITTSDGITGWVSSNYLEELRGE